MAFLFSKEKRVVFSRRVKGFWEEFRQTKIGLVGIALISFYVLMAIFAPLLATHDPTREWGLASGWAMPEWVTIFPQYSDAARTMKPSLDWVIGQSSAFVSVTTGEGWVAEYRGNESATIKILSSFDYPYRAPGDFHMDFWWEVQPVEAAEYIGELYVVSPLGAEYLIWSTYQSTSATPLFTNRTTAAIPMVMRSVALKPNILARLGVAEADNPCDRIFIEKGEYKLTFKIDFKPASEGTVRISVTQVIFRILGRVHGMLGTDHLGGDVWSQLVWGARVSLAVGFTAAILATSLGISIGIIAGFSGGAVDEVTMRIVDILLCLPVLPLLLGFFKLWGPNVFYLVLLIAVFGWQGLSRIVRSQVLYLKEMPFIECARAAGASKYYIMFRHLLPNVVPVALASLVLSVPAAVLTESALSFIGFGDPNIPTWGRILNQAFSYGAFRYLSWHWILPPGIALTTLTLSFVFVGHAVDAVVNPRLRRRR